MKGDRVQSRPPDEPRSGLTQDSDILTVMLVRRSFTVVSKNLLIARNPFGRCGTNRQAKEDSQSSDANNRKLAG